jgi:hypothetical protein
MHAISIGVVALKYVKNQTEEICMFAVKKHWKALQYVRNQTEKICMFAIDQDWRALNLCRIRTIELCARAIKKDERSLRLCENRTILMQFQIFKQIGLFPEFGYGFNGRYDERYDKRLINSL